jgi:prevent-host-death family protein
MRAEQVTTLKRRATEILSEINRSKEPVMITMHGLPSVYIVDVDEYEFERNRTKILEGIARGERAIAEGDVYTQDEVEERLAKWLK